MPNRITGADEITRIERVPEWKQRIDDFAETHPIDFEYDPEKGFMTPSLVCTSISFSQLRSSLFEITVSVTNKGNGISFSSYLETYVRRKTRYGYEPFWLYDYRILTINPGQIVNVKLEFKLYWLGNEKIVGVCYDPILDPRGFQIEELNDDIHLNELVKHNDHIIQPR